MIKAAIFGFGNVGRAVAQTLALTPDFSLVGIVSSHSGGGEFLGAQIVSDERKLPQYEVAILARPSRDVPETAARLLGQGRSTVDSFDIHGEIPAVRRRLSSIARDNGAVSLLAAGWDPGTDSVVRALLEAAAPRGITYTNFGPGMSMGHTVAVKAIAGVRDALSVTIPLGTGIHRRVVYVELADGHTLESVAARIKADEYFSNDETRVIAVPSAAAMRDAGHGVHIERRGGSGETNNQRFSFDMSIDNPALTAQVMVCAARAATRQRPGCYTLIEIPPADLLPGTRDDAVARLV